MREENESFDLRYKEKRNVESVGNFRAWVPFGKELGVCLGRFWSLVFLSCLGEVLGIWTLRNETLPIMNSEQMISKVQCKADFQFRKRRIPPLPNPMHNMQ